MHRLLKINKIVGNLWTSYMTDETCVLDSTNENALSF